MPVAPVVPSNSSEWPYWRSFSSTQYFYGYRDLNPVSSFYLTYVFYQFSWKGTPCNCATESGLAHLGLFLTMLVRFVGSLWFRLQRCFELKFETLETKQGFKKVSFHWRTFGLCRQVKFNNLNIWWLMQINENRKAPGFESLPEQTHRVSHFFSVGFCTSR